MFLYRLMDGHFLINLIWILCLLKAMANEFMNHILQKKNVKSVIMYIIRNLFLKYGK